MKTTKILLTLVLYSTLLFSSGRSYAHGGITIDGDCSADWGSSVPAQIHSSQLFSEGGGVEWVYLGASDDARTDGTESNNDIIEVRFTGDATFLYFCVKMKDITDWSIPNINIAVDTDRSPTDDKLNWIGHQTCTDTDLCGGLESYAITDPENYVERQFNVHYDGFHDFNSAAVDHIQILREDTYPVSWYPVDPNMAVANVDTEIVEGQLSWSTLGCGPSACSEIKINLTTYRNNPNYNDSGDTTVDRTDHDGVDLMGGTPGVNENAWYRDFYNGELSSFHLLRFDPPTAVALQDAHASAQSSSEPILIGLLMLSSLGLIGLKYSRKHQIT